MPARQEALGGPMHRIVFSSVTALAFVISACGKSEESPPPQNPGNAQPYGNYGGANNGQPQNGATPAPSQTAGGPTVAPIGTVGSDPATLQNILAGALAGSAAML